MLRQRSGPGAVGAPGKGRGGVGFGSQRRSHYILLLADEKFDFDLSVSSLSANEDDEVFFGPIGHKERCIAASLELNNQIPKEPPPPASESLFAWSPLTGEKFVEVYKEAHLLALQIQSSSRNEAAQAAKHDDPGSQGADGFIQESALKINLFEKENEVKKSPKSLKRETYCLSAGAPPEQPGTPASGSLTQAQTAGQRGPGLSSPFGLSRSSQMKAPGAAREHDSCPSTKARVVATPTKQFKIPKFSAGEPPGGATPKPSRAQRPQSCTAVGRVVRSTPARQPLASQSLAGVVGTPLSARRMSALPTPASRRLSSLPLVTPKTVPRVLASPLHVSARRLSSEPQKKSAVRAAPARDGCGRAASGPADTSLDGSFSPPSAVPQALSFSPEKSDFTFSKSIAAEAAAPEATPPRAVLVDVKLEQLSITPEAAGAPPGDLLLIDFCRTPEANMALGSESGPLGDLLTNTPDVNRKVAAKPPHEVGQLIDLSSPLILLSPEADKENVESPLLKF
uniref:G2 and S phase-expressed protein 1 N-terminal domain-containing protein n=1 Tax=Catagonus wagneri TaxID=51154 RepID=A0A8C3VZG7_9CETA